MSKHTEGPWSRIDTPDYAEIHAPGHDQPVALVARGEDADLVAASPDLLVALKALLEVAEAHIPEGHGPHPNPAYGPIEIARAAIAKAEAGDE